MTSSIIKESEGVLVKKGGGELTKPCKAMYFGILRGEFPFSSVDWRVAVFIQCLVQEWVPEP